MKEKKYWILVGLLLIFMVNTVSANVFFKYGEIPIQLKRECFFDGALCNESFNCTLSVYDPNLKLLTDNVGMNRTTAFYYHNITSFLEVGMYRNRMTCGDGTHSGSEIFYFEITPTGAENKQNFFLILVFSSLGILALAYLIKSDEIGVLSGILLTVSGVYSMINGIDGIYNLYSRAIAGSLIALGILFMIASSYNLFRKKEE